MDEKHFATLLVDLLVDKRQADLPSFYRDAGIDPTRLDDADEIWKLFVRYNLDAGGIKSTLVKDRWKGIAGENILTSRRRLLESVDRLKPEQCYENFTKCCPMTFTKKTGISNKGNCTVAECPVIEITQLISWHKEHYKIAKKIAECAKRLLLQSQYTHNGNLNEIVKAICDKHRNSCDNWRQLATTEFLSLFTDIKEYGKPPKVVIWLLSDLSSPIHQINHWPDIDHDQLVPIDTHVERLVKRFGWVPKSATNEEIRCKVVELYSAEPRKLDFALYRLGGEMEENICRKVPDCKKCHTQFREIYDACSNRRNLVS